jgi:hypothetical protein
MCKIPDIQTDDIVVELVGNIVDKLVNNIICVVEHLSND